MHKVVWNFSDVGVMTPDNLRQTDMIAIDYEIKFASELSIHFVKIT